MRPLPKSSSPSRSGGVRECEGRLPTRFRTQGSYRAAMALRESTDLLIEAGSWRSLRFCYGGSETHRPAIAPLKMCRPAFSTEAKIQRTNANSASAIRREGGDVRSSMAGRAKKRSIFTRPQNLRNQVRSSFGRLAKQRRGARDDKPIPWCSVALGRYRSAIRRPSAPRC